VRKIHYQDSRFFRMKTIELYHPRNNPRVMVPRLFIRTEELHRMRPSTNRIVRTLQHEFRDLCLYLAIHKAKLVIQEIPDKTHWKVHVIKDGMVWTSTTRQRTLVDAVRLAWSQHNVKPAEEPADTMASVAG
jgi:hypothetical protein